MKSFIRIAQFALMLFSALITEQTLAQNTNRWSPIDPEGPSYQKLEAYGATNENFAPAIQFFMATLQGHQPTELPAGVTPEEIATAAHMVFPAANLIVDKPIFFYGKVLDEKGQPVAGAKIHFQWKGFIKIGPSTEDAVSDSTGKFVLRNKSGQELYVSVVAAGYYEMKQNRDKTHYSYASSFQEIFKPDPTTPVVYNFQKKGQGADLTVIDYPPGMGQRFQLRSDGTSLEVDLLKGEKAADGHGNIKLQFWRASSDKNARTFDWKLQLSVPGEGLVGTAEEFAFQAPENGYLNPAVINMPSTNEPWQGQGEIRTNYYIHLADGKYGRIDLELMPYNGIYRIHSTINASGSRNLEPK